MPGPWSCDASDVQVQVLLVRPARPVQAAMALPGDIQASEKTLTHTD